MKIVRTLEKLINEKAAIEDKIEAILNENFIGKEVVWRKGRYKGRKAIIRSAICSRVYNGPEHGWGVEIEVTANTFRLDGKECLKRPWRYRSFLDFEYFFDSKE